jgi:hypothetical protein
VTDVVFACVPTSTLCAAFELGSERLDVDTCGGLGDGFMRCCVIPRESRGSVNEAASRSLRFLAFLLDPQIPFLFRLKRNQPEPTTDPEGIVGRFWFNTEPLSARSTRGTDHSASSVRHLARRIDEHHVHGCIGFSDDEDVCDVSGKRGRECDAVVQIGGGIVVGVDAIMYVPGSMSSDALVPSNAMLLASETEPVVVLYKSISPTVCARCANRNANCRGGNVRDVVERSVDVSVDVVDSPPTASVQDCPA